MYDNIRLLLPYPFKTENDLNTFCKRFGLFVKDEKKGILHNKGYETLEQNRGIYIRLEMPTQKRKGNVAFSFSLHKFYNSSQNKGLSNFNDFSFKQANEAYKMLTELMPIDVSKAVVKKYEVGINIATTGNPDDYMKELNLVKVKDREMRIIEDLHYREYKQYSTHKDKGKRIVYIFYNKTFEARSKQKDPDKRDNIPDNILRAEKDNRRPMEKIYFSQLFNPAFQQLTKNEFRKRFVSDLHYKAYPVKTKGITTKQLELWKLIQEKGEAETLEHYQTLFNQGAITRDQLRYVKNNIKLLLDEKIQPDISISKNAKRLKQMIIDKLKTM